ncbi:MAG: DUF1109 family protein [Bryobacterales bacterium]|nr:DUF1109 family protein [Bryobacterales bacterium]
MTCEDLDRRLSEGARAADLAAEPAVATHLARCPECARLMAWLLRGIGDVRVDSARASEIARTGLKPVRSLPPARTLIMSLAAIVAGVAGLHVVTMGADGWPLLSGSQAIVFAAFLAVTLALLAPAWLSSLRPGARQRVHPVAAVLLLAAGFPALAALLFPVRLAEGLAAEGVRCVAGGAMAAAMASGLLFLVTRRGYPLDWGRTGALLGAIGGLAAVAALQVSCPRHEAVHLALWHGLALILPVLAGFLAGRRAG